MWPNPPVRIGKTALHSLLTGWLDRLAPAAAAYLVMQRNLGSDSLQRWLSESGWTAERAAARAGYRVPKVTGTRHLSGAARRRAHSGRPRSSGSTGPGAGPAAP